MVHHVAPSPERLRLNYSYDNDDDSIDSNFDPEIPTISTTGSVDALELAISAPSSSLHHVSTTSSSVAVGKSILKYDAATIRTEFKSYQSVLPRPDELLQEKHSFAYLRTKIKESGIDLPRFLKYNFEGGIKPHHALCCLLLSEYQAGVQRKRNAVGEMIVRLLSFGQLHIQLNHPADFIRDQFYRCAPAVPTDPVKPQVLRKMIKNRGLPVPNYFLDPEDGKQFAPHIALLVVLQEKEGKRLNGVANRLAFSLFAMVALLLRIVLEVIGGAGAIWGGAEVVKLRTANNAELWRWISIAVGVLCFLRFVTLNAPQKEDVSHVLGPAGPWSLRLPARLRAVCEHPFHYFVRALPPSSPRKKKGQ